MSNFLKLITLEKIYNFYVMEDQRYSTCYATKLRLRLRMVLRSFDRLKSIPTIACQS